MVAYTQTVAKSIERVYRSPQVVFQREQTLQRMAVQQGEHVLDAGCGTGFLLLDIAQAVGAKGAATGCDFSNDMLAIAREYTADYPHVSLNQASVTDLPYQRECFDQVVSTQTLLYVEQVEQALTEMWRVLKPGGQITIVETDWRGLVLNSDDHAITQQMTAGWDAAVASPNLPPRLKPLLTGAGFSSVNVHAIPIIEHDYVAGGYCADMLQWMADYAVKQGRCSQDQADGWLSQFPRLAEKNGFFFCINRFLFTAKKPV